MLSRLWAMHRRLGPAQPDLSSTRASAHPWLPAIVCAVLLITVAAGCIMRARKAAAPPRVANEAVPAAKPAPEPARLSPVSSGMSSAVSLPATDSSFTRELKADTAVPPGALSPRTTLISMAGQTSLRTHSVACGSMASVIAQRRPIHDGTCGSRQLHELDASSASAACVGRGIADSGDAVDDVANLQLVARNGSSSSYFGVCLSCCSAICRIECTCGRPR